MLAKCLAEAKDGVIDLGIANLWNDEQRVLKKALSEHIIEDTIRYRYDSKTSYTQFCDIEIDGKRYTVQSYAYSCD